jgi:hypothetical protein
MNAREPRYEMGMTSHFRVGLLQILKCHKRCVE